MAGSAMFAFRNFFSFQRLAALPDFLHGRCPFLHGSFAIQFKLGTMKTLRVGALIAFAAVPAAHAAEPKEFVIACPATIETTQALRVQTPPGWIQVADDPDHGSEKRWKNTHRLRGIGFSDGHPSNLVTLVPENSNEYGRGRKFVQRWPLIDSAGLYATCEYDQTTVELTQPIPAGYKVCEVRYEKKPSIELVGASCIK